MKDCWKGPRGEASQSVAGRHSGGRQAKRARDWGRDRAQLAPSLSSAFAGADGWAFADCQHR